MPTVPPKPTPAELHLARSAAAHMSWANTADRTARTAKARAGLEKKFLEQADGDPVRAAHLRKAHFAQLALKSARARRRAREAELAAQDLATAADAAEAEFRAMGSPDAA